MSSPVRVAPQVREALDAGRAVVALESTIISHGLPSSAAEQVGRQIEAAVREGGAVPATIAVLDGQVHVGLSPQALHRVATDRGVVKTSIRDLGTVMASGAQGMIGATTVASTAYLAHRTGIRVFATGGLGGVHRTEATATGPAPDSAASYDESADLLALASTPLAVVCAGVKSILEIGATLERLETLSVALIGYRTDRFPAFYIRESAYPVPWRAESPRQIADICRSRWALGLPQAMVVANPIPKGSELDRDLHDRTLHDALNALRNNDIHGKDVTPFLLAYFHEHTGGRSLAANVELVRDNARLAGSIAAELASNAATGCGREGT